LFIFFLETYIININDINEVEDKYLRVEWTAWRCGVLVPSRGCGDGF